MTLDRRLLLLSMLLMGCGLVAVKAAKQHREDTGSNARHRHRHRHEPAARRSDRHDLTIADRRSPTWSQELDYEDGSFGDREDEGEDDYDAYYERSYPRSARISLHGRMFASRYPARYHDRGYRDWFDGEDERRGASPRWRSYWRRYDRTRHRPRTREESSSDYEDEKSSYELDRQQHSWWKNGRKHRIGSRRDWHLDGRKRHRHDDSEENKRIDEWRKRTNSSGKRTEDSDDYEYHEPLEDREKDEEEEDASAEDENRTEDDEDFDNDFFKGEKKPPLKSFDDIIRRLTADDPGTVKPTAKRDYRNTGVDRYAKRDAFAYLKMEIKNVTRPLPQGKGSYVGAASQLSKKVAENAPKLEERKFARNAQEKKTRSKIEDAQAKTKSLEQDYDEYLNTPDNEKEEDLIKAGVEEDTGMQADVTNTDYVEDEDEEESSFSAGKTTTTTTAATTSSTTTTTTTTTTTPRPPSTQNYDYREHRVYESSGTGPQYNGYQGKNDYPPMSAHSMHKWQSLGTRESVKETRGNMQQYNKNGKTAEIREALQHAIKVSREGSCQWPRPRVIPVRDVYPSPSTTYVPHCAILHRCSDDTGCCRSEALTCVPKHSHRVELSFYTTSVGGASVVEKLSFYNHTECECRERTEYDTTNEKPSEQRVYRHYHQPSPQPQNMRRAQPRKPCRCPSEFTPRITPEGECHCNCYENHQNCIKIRRGKGYFSLSDRLCIQNEECAMPSCEFGEYMRRQGKCPKRKDKFDAIVNFRTNLNHRYRS
ncbi:uncharacterized protein LOC143360458 [Halictus rubicundus]|uniref:uncharacterized protein LOC143360458 n=1 Tax=Halictus rubicundus TaxID=77578 RepID=UPI004035122D